MPLLASLALTTLVGAVVGAALRWVLARVPRGTRVGRGPCEVGVVAVWLPVSAAVGAGVAAPAWAPLWAAVGMLAVAGSVTDVVDRRLPDAITVTGLVAVLAAAVPLGVDALGRALPGAVVLTGGHVAIAVTRPGALGGGDVKLAPALGAALGVAGWWALVGAPFVAAVAVLGMAVASRRRAVPYGPPALLSTWVAVGLATITLGPSP